MSIVLLLLASGGGLPPFADLLRHRWPGSPPALPWENRPAQDTPHPQNVEIKAARTERGSPQWESGFPAIGAQSVATRSSHIGDKPSGMSPRRMATCELSC
jgi:hypothetical protein